MSTPAHAAPLYAVPTPPPHAATIRFALLLRARDVARQVFDRAVAAPRAAAGYVVRHLRTFAAGLPTPVATALGRLGHRLAGAAALVRAVGVVPVVGALLTVPAVQRRVNALLSRAGRLTADLGTTAWCGAAALLGRCGPVGRSIVVRLDALGNRVCGAVKAAKAHPDAQLLTEAGRSTARLAGHIVRGVAVHRTLRFLLPVTWLRVLVEVAALPLLLDRRLADQLRGALRNAAPTRTGGSVTGEVPTLAVVDTAAPVTSDEAAAPVADLPAEEAAAVEELVEPRNRAERREQQRDEAQAKRSRAPRR